MNNFKSKLIKSIVNKVKISKKDILSVDVVPKTEFENNKNRYKSFNSIKRGINYYIYDRRVNNFYSIEDIAINIKKIFNFNGYFILIFDDIDNYYLYFKNTIKPFNRDLNTDLITISKSTRIKQDFKKLKQIILMAKESVLNFDEILLIDLRIARHRKILQSNNFIFNTIKDIEIESKSNIKVKTLTHSETLRLFFGTFIIEPLSNKIVKFLFLFIFPIITIYLINDYEIKVAKKINLKNEEKISNFHSKIKNLHNILKDKNNKKNNLILEIEKSNKKVMIW